MLALSNRPTAVAAPPVRLRALHVLGSLGRGGVEKWLVEAVASGPRNRWALDFCLLSGTEGEWAERVRAAGSRIYHCSLSESRARSAPGFLARLAALIRRGRWPVVHSHVMHASAAVLAAARLAGAPVRVAHAHTSAKRPAEGILRRLYEAASQETLRQVMTDGMGCSEAATNLLYGCGWRRDPRVRIFYCGVCLARFQAQAPTRKRYLRELQLPPETVVAGHVGRFQWQKNHSFVLDIAAAAAKLNPRFRLVLVGGGPDEGAVRAKVAGLGIAEHVRLAGPRDDVPEMMRSLFDVLLLPSVSEGLPVTLLEAQAAGLPAVIADHITREADAVPEAIHRTALTASASRWAALALQAAGSGRCDPRETVPRLAAAGFDAAETMTRLTAIYEARLQGQGNGMLRGLS